MSTIRHPARAISNNAKWEAFQPEKLDGVDKYTGVEIGKVFGVTKVTVYDCLSGRNHLHNPVLCQKIQEFAKEVGYKVEDARREAIKRGHDVQRMKNLSEHHYDSIQQREQHMRMLRDCGYTNAQIARITGYTAQTVIRVIGREPKEYTNATKKKNWAIYSSKVQ